SISAMADQFPTFRRWLDGAARVASAPPRWRFLSSLVERMDRRRPGFVRATWKQYIAFAAMLACLLVMICLAIPGNPLTVWYWMSIVGPTQEARYGFHVKLNDQNANCVEIASVQEGGEFDRAGINAGWRVWAPSGAGGHAGEAFFRQLRDSDAPDLELRFWIGGCNSREGEMVRRTVALGQSASVVAARARHRAIMDLEETPAIEPTHREDPDFSSIHSVS